MVAAPTRRSQLRIYNADSDDVAEIELSKNSVGQVGHWSNYPQTVVNRIANNFPGRLSGADLVFSCNLPRSSGMSSSSALIVGTFLIMSELNHLSEHPNYERCISSDEDLASYLSAIENGSSFKTLRGFAGVGTFGGSQDHTGILCARPAALVCYSFCPVEFRKSITVDERLSFVVASSGVIAEKTGAAMAKYNRLAAQVSEIVQIWNRFSGREDHSLAAIFGSAPQAAEELQNAILEYQGISQSHREQLLDRLNYFAVENDLVLQLPDVLDQQTARDFGELARVSHDSAVRFLKHNVPETDSLVELARDLGATAVSAFGAGFGGSVWSLVPAKSAGEFRDKWQTNYRSRYPEAAARSEFFSTRPSVSALTWTK